ncbi:EamA family transporter [Pseudomonas syringae pv. maculicola]|nr:EamA family transporter [Pseudomonas syringae pv. maculicola]
MPVAKVKPVGEPSVSTERTSGSARPQLGIVLCLLSMLIFATQDGITKVLVKDLPVAQMIMVRYWVFVIFAVGYATCHGSLRASVRSAKPGLQITRALLGVTDVVLFAFGLRFLGLAQMHALYAVFPLMTLGLAGMILGEFIGLRRWIAAAVGFAGTFVILRMDISRRFTGYYRWFIRHKSLIQTAASRHRWHAS